MSYDYGRGFDGFHHKETLHGVEHVEAAESFGHKAAVAFHVGHLHFEHVVECTRNIITFSYFRHFFDLFGKIHMYFGVDVAQAYVAHHHKTAAYLVEVEEGCVATYYPAVFQSSESFEDRCRRAVYPCGQLPHREAAVFLQFAENVDVCRVEEVVVGFAHTQMFLIIDKFRLIIEYVQLFRL